MTKEKDDAIEGNMKDIKKEEKFKESVLKDIDFKQKIEEIKKLKAEIQWLRCELNNFLTTFVNVSDNNSEKKFADEITKKLLVLRKSLLSYIEHYNTLLPFIKLGRQHIGLTTSKVQEVRLKPYVRQKAKTLSTTQPKKPGKV